MRLVFMGTPEFAVPSLEALASAHKVSLVVTRPDAVRSRGKKLEPSPVKKRATELGIPVVEASRITDEILGQVRNVAPECIVVAAFGCILPQALLDIPTLECINVHASLLPRWRGAAPIQRAILAGDSVQGVSIMRVVKALDAGAYCRQATLDATSGGASELTVQLANLGAQELLCALDDIAAGQAHWTEQDESQVTYAHKIEKGELLLNPALDAATLERYVRASSDAAPARVKIGTKTLRVMAAQVADAPQEITHGEVYVANKSVWLGCASGALQLLRVKPDGKREMDVAAWVAGIHGQELVWAHV